MVDCTTVIPKIFLIGALLGAIGCLSKADYNLPVFLFAYIAWNYLRVRCLILKYTGSGRFPAAEARDSANPLGPEDQSRAAVHHLDHHRLPLALLRRVELMGQ